ncbi:MAG: hypothetical protein L3K06_02235, partial [Thermoplasmata archaeon]|nr:hypothetical protein [Thermoplasmata archaeon]
MRSPDRRALLAAIAVVVLFAIPSGWSGSLSAGPISPAVASPVGAPSALPPATFVPAGVHPAIVCPPYFPTYSQVGTPAVWPIVPDQLFQFPCPRISEDEVHASFGSTTAGSGQRWTMPVHVPIDGTTRQIASYLQFYVGMVVTGNAFSEGKQTYAAVVFQPSGAPVSTYVASVHLFSFLNMSHVPGYCPGMELSWNDSFYCEQDDMANSSGQGGLVAGDWVNLTFAGSRSQTSGL